MKKFYKIFLYSLFLILCCSAGTVHAATEIYNEVIFTNTTWNLDGSPYILHGSVLVNTGATLTIEPGTIIKSTYSNGIYLEGSLIADGVYFTSIYDDSIGGDFDGDEGLFAPSNADWTGINVFNGGNVQINNSHINYAENSVYLDLATGNIDNTIITKGKDALFVTNNSLLNINDSNIEDVSDTVLFLYQNSTTTIINSSIKNTGEVLYMFKNSFLSLLDTDITNTNRLIFFQDSVLDIKNIEANNVSGYPFINFYQGSKLDLNNSSIKNVSGMAISAYGASWDGYSTTTLNISSSTIIDGDGVGLQLYGDKFEANINKTKIINFSGDGLQTFSDASIRIDRSEISKNNNGVVSWGADTEIKNSIISDNITYGISNNPTESGAKSVTAINNWWGDKSGPYNDDTNDSGTANQVSSNVTYTPWLIYDPRVVRKTPVIIVPGVMGTELKDDTQLLWLNLEKMLTDIGDDFLDTLSFSEDIQSNHNILTTNIIHDKNFAGLVRYSYSTNLINKLTDFNYLEGTSSDATLFTFPYDWRYGVTGINTDGKTSADLLNEKIQEVLEQTGSKSVDVIAHSTGGLIVKKYVIDNPDSHKVNKAVFVGVPNTGAPKAVKALIQGDSADIPWLSSTEMKKLSRNFPVTYDLLPSQKYYDIKGSYIKIIKETFMKDTVVSDLDYSSVDIFLIENHSLNSQALMNAKNLHTQSFDDFDMRNAGIDLYSINGCKTGTLGKIVEVQHTGYGGRKSVYYNKPEIVPGDGTVPLESSTNLPIDQDNKYYALKASHGEMMSQDGIKDIITNIISLSQLPINDKLITQDISKCKLNGKAISVFSPVILDIVDQEGNHSGITIDGDVVNDIPNADVQVWDDHKFVYLPTDDGQTYTVNMKGTGKGTYTIKSDFVVEGQTTKTDTFTDLPVTSELTGSIDISSDITTLSVKATAESQIEIIKPDSHRIQNAQIQQTGGAGSSLFIKDTATRIVVAPAVKEVISTTTNKEIKISTSALAVKNTNVQKNIVTKNISKPKERQVATVAEAKISTKTSNYFMNFIRKIIFFWKR